MIISTDLRCGSLQHVQCKVIRLIDVICIIQNGSVGSNADNFVNICCICVSGQVQHLKWQKCGEIIHQQNELCMVLSGLIESDNLMNIHTTFVLWVAATFEIQ